MQALDSANLIGNDKMRELSAMNSTLYEFLLRDEHVPAEEKIVRHVVLKADVRDSSRLTRSLLERGLNPASYFSLNFYDPVNKLLAKYGATKVFLEGDAIILALLEHQNQPAMAVARACVLAREMIEIVRGYNQLLGARRAAGAGAWHWHLLSGFGAHVSAGRRRPHHDLRCAERKRPPGFLQQDASARI